MNFVCMMCFATTSRGCPCFSYMANRKQGRMTAIITTDARLVPALSLSKKKSGSPKIRAAAKQMICRFVRLKATFVLTLDKSFGTGTYAKRKPPFCGEKPRGLLMCVEYGFCQCAGFEQGEAENNGVSCKGENRAVQVIRYNHAIY